MKSFYLVQNKEIKKKLYEYEVFHLSMFCPPEILTVDIQDWIKKAEHGNIFEINYDITILCLDLEKFNI
jgi:hypothetical protein